MRHLVLTSVRCLLCVPPPLMGQVSIWRFLPLSVPAFARCLRPHPPWRGLHPSCHASWPPSMTVQSRWGRRGDFRRQVSWVNGSRGSNEVSRMVLNVLVSIFFLDDVGAKIGFRGGVQLWLWLPAASPPAKRSLYAIQSRLNIDMGMPKGKCLIQLVTL